MKATIILQHGWAMDGSVFSKWKRALDSLAIQLTNSNRLELNYFVAERGYFNSANDVSLSLSTNLDRKILVVAHSLGLHLIPSVVRENADFLLSLSSFANFHQDAQVGARLSKRRLERMLTKLQAEPQKVLHDFWTECDLPFGARPAELEGSMNLTRLVSDLELLNQVDIQPGLWPRKTKVCVLQGNRDSIVSLDHGRTLCRIFDTNNFLEVNGANHLAPALDPDAGLFEVVKFLRGIA